MCGYSVFPATKCNQTYLTKPKLLKVDIMIELIQTYLIVSLTIYFFPFLLSLLTGNRIGSVFVMNFFLGWTFIGWVWALVWAVTPDRKQDQVIVHNHLPNEKVTIEREKTIQEVASSEQQIDKASLLNQLSQLHSLREKNVITEDMNMNSYFLKRNGIKSIYFGLSQVL
jgi:hypothetical protein